MVIELIPRLDVSRQIKVIFKAIKLELYASPSDIESYGHFEQDNVHINTKMGVSHAVQLFKQEIEPVS